MGGPKTVAGRDEGPSDDELKAIAVEELAGPQGALLTDPERVGPAGIKQTDIDEVADSIARPEPRMSFLDLLRQVEDAGAGETVEVAPGVYTGQLKVSKSVRVVGLGRVALENPEGDVVVVSAGATLQLEGVDVRATAKGGDAVFIDGGRATVRESRLSATGASAVHIGPSGGEVDLYDCRLEGGPVQCIHVAAGSLRAVRTALRGSPLGVAARSRAARVVLEDVEILDCSDGLEAKDYCTVELLRLRVTCPGSPIAVRSGVTFDAADCRLEAFGGDVTVSDASRASFRGTAIRGGAMVSVHGPGAELRMDECTVADMQKHGIWAWGGGRAILRGTELLDNGQAGIRVQDAQGLLEIERSTVRGSIASGVEVGEGARAAIVGSAIEANGGSGVHVEGFRASAAVHDSTVARNRGHGVFIDRDGAIDLDSVRVKDNDKCGLACTGRHARLEVVGCTVDGNGENALYVDDGAMAAVSTSSLTGNEDYDAVWSSDQSMVTLAPDNMIAE